MKLYAQYGLVDKTQNLLTVTKVICRQCLITVMNGVVKSLKYETITD